MEAIGEEEKLIDSREVVVLRNGDDDDVRFELIDTVEIEGEEYSVLVPLDEKYMDEGMMILRVEGAADQNNIAYVSVEDMYIQDKVLAAYKEQQRRRVPLCNLPLSWLLRPDPVVRYFD